MRTNRCKAFRIGAAVAVFVCCTPGLTFGQQTGAGQMLSPRHALDAARERNLDILYVYVTDEMSAGGRQWLDELTPSGTAGRLLSDRFVICKMKLPTSFVKGDQALLDSVRSAMNHGVNAVPAMVLCDSEGRAYSRLFGGIRHQRDAQGKAVEILGLAEVKKHRDDLLAQSAASSGQEKAALILSALQSVPRECWFRDYPAQMAFLGQSACTDPGFVAAAIAANRNRGERKILDVAFAMSDKPGIEQIDAVLTRICQLIESEDFDRARKQHLLLTFVYPLYVNKAFRLYQGANNGELEEAFNQSIDILEQVRDMDRDSKWGRQAHAIREELRKARLAAAKYD